MLHLHYFAWHIFKDSFIQQTASILLYMLTACINSDIKNSYFRLTITIKGKRKLYIFRSLIACLWTFWKCTKCTKVLCIKLDKKQHFVHAISSSFLDSLLTEKWIFYLIQLKQVIFAIFRYWNMYCYIGQFQFIAPER